MANDMTEAQRRQLDFEMQRQENIRQAYLREMARDEAARQAAARK